MHGVLSQQEGLAAIGEVLLQAQPALDVAGGGEGNPVQQSGDRAQLEAVQRPQRQRRNRRHGHKAPHCFPGERGPLTPLRRGVDHDPNSQHRIQQQGGQLHALCQSQQQRRDSPPSVRGPLQPARPCPQRPETEGRRSHVGRRQTAVGEEVGIQGAECQRERAGRRPGKGRRDAVDRGGEKDGEQRRRDAGRHDDPVQRAVSEQRLLGDGDQSAVGVTVSGLRRGQIGHEEEGPGEERFGERGMLVEELHVAGAQIFVAAGDVKRLINGGGKPGRGVEQQRPLEQQQRHRQPAGRRSTSLLHGRTSQ